MGNQSEIVYISDDKSFASYIYQDVHNENRIFWKTMFTVLGMFFLALGYILGKGEKGNLTSDFGSVYFLISQLIWLIAMIEVLLFSNFNWKRRFLFQVELFFKPTLETEEIKTPYWEHWVKRNKFSGFSGYNIAVWSIILWSFSAFIWVAHKAADIAPPAGREINWIFAIILSVELLVGLISCGFALMEGKRASGTTEKESEHNKEDTQKVTLPS